MHLRSSGRSFHSLGAAATKARSPRVGTVLKSGVNRRRLRGADRLGVREHVQAVFSLAGKNSGGYEYGLGYKERERSCRKNTSKWLARFSRAKH